MTGAIPIPLMSATDVPAVTCRRVGAAIARQLQPLHSWTDIAAELGTTREGAYHIGVVALGRLAFRLQAQFAQEITHD